MQAVRESDVGTHIVAIEVEAKNLLQLDNESGGHRIQRVPPTERKGRVHTSTVTVAVIDPTVAVRLEYAQRDKNNFKMEWFSGTGAGGQHRNKHQNSCRLIHIPTGLKQEAQCRSRQDSYQKAYAQLIEQLDRLTRGDTCASIAASRKALVGSGQRGDKIRTYRFQANQIRDHRSGKVATCDQVMSGRFELLW